MSDRSRNQARVSGSEPHPFPILLYPDAATTLHTHVDDERVHPSQLPLHSAVQFQHIHREEWRLLYQAHLILACRIVRSVFPFHLEVQCPSRQFRMQFPQFPIPVQGFNLRPPQMTGYKLGWKSKGYNGCIDWGLSIVDRLRR